MRTLIGGKFMYNYGNFVNPGYSDYIKQYANATEYETTANASTLCATIHSITASSTAG